MCNLSQRCGFILVQWTHATSFVQFFLLNTMSSNETWARNIDLQNLTEQKDYNLLKYISPTCTRTSCFPTELMRIEKRDRSTRGRRVASAKRIATEMIPSMTAKSFSTSFLSMQRQKNSAKGENQSWFQLRAWLFNIQTR